MSCFNAGEREGYPDLPAEELIKEGIRKPSPGSRLKSILSSCPTLAHAGQRAILHGAGLDTPVGPISEWARDPVLVSYALRQAAPWVVFLGSFLVYTLTLAPSVFWDYDSAEFAATAYSLGIPHATGYPLYLLVAKLFTYLPVGEVAYRLNLMSAFFASGAVTIIYLLSLVITGRALLSIATAGFLAFSYFLWSSAVFTEVYSLHVFLTVLTIYLLLRWDREGNNGFLYGGIFIWGLSFGNHMTTALLGPAITALLGLGLWEQRIKWRQLLPLGACFIIPLTVYAYLPLRYLAGAEINYMSYFTSEGVQVGINLATREGLWWALTGQQFGGLFMQYRGAEFVDQIFQMMFLVYGNFLGVGFVLGIMGLIRNYIVDKRRLIFLGLVFLANILFFAGFGAIDKQFMFVICQVVWAIWIADGIYYFVSGAENTLRSERWGRPESNIGKWMRQVRWETATLALPIAALWVNYSYVDLSSVTHLRDTYPEIMASFEPDALVLGWWADTSPMIYYQTVEKLRPDVQIIDRFRISRENENKLIDRSLPYRPVYVFEGMWRDVPHPKYELPAFSGTYFKAYKVIPP